MLKKIRLKKIFRIDYWWKSKAALLMGMVYLFTAWFNISFDKFIWLALLSITTISGFASLGYLLNDLFDLKKDAIAGKRNFLSGQPIALGILFFLVAASLLFLPWKFLPFNSNSAILIAAELGMFILYSTPPIRLKERGLLGIFADALYAHALPVALAAYTFSLAAKTELILLPLFLLCCWQAFSGIRNILLHQEEDIVADKKSGVNNFVESMSNEKFFATLKLCIILELGFSLLFFLFISIKVWTFLLCVGLILFFSVTSFVIFYNPGIAVFLQTRWKYFPNSVFEKWLPVVILLGLSLGNPLFLVILLLHIILFNFNFFAQFSNQVLSPFTYWSKSVAIGGTITIKRIFSFLLNYTIYVAFLVFGINLKQEKLSALEYLKKKVSAKTNSK